MKHERTVATVQRVGPITGSAVGCLSRWRCATKWTTAFLRGKQMDDPLRGCWHVRCRIAAKGGGGGRVTRTLMRAAARGWVARAYWAADENQVAHRRSPRLADRLPTCTATCRTPPPPTPTPPRARPFAFQQSCSPSSMHPIKSIESSLWKFAVLAQCALEKDRANKLSQTCMSLGCRAAMQHVCFAVGQHTRAHAANARCGSANALPCS